MSESLAFPFLYGGVNYFQSVCEIGCTLYIGLITTARLELSNILSKSDAIVPCTISTFYTGLKDY